MIACEASNEKTIFPDFPFFIHFRFCTQNVFVCPSGAKMACLGSEGTEQLDALHVDTPRKRFIRWKWIFNANYFLEFPSKPFLALSLVCATWSLNKKGRWPSSDVVCCRCSGLLTFGKLFYEHIVMMMTFPCLSLSNRFMTMNFPSSLKAPSSDSIERKNLPFRRREMLGKFASLVSLSSRFPSSLTNHFMHC